MKARSALVLSCVLLCLACGNKTEPPAPQPAIAPAAPEATEAKSDPAPEEVVEIPSEAALPVPEDFEDESAKTIDEQNYKAELATLEKEINADDKAP